MMTPKVSTNRTFLRFLMLEIQWLMDINTSDVLSRVLSVLRFCASLMEVVNDGALSLGSGKTLTKRNLYFYPHYSGRCP